MTKHLAAAALVASCLSALVFAQARGDGPGRGAANAPPPVFFKEA